MPAPAALANRFRAVALELKVLDRDLTQAGERNLADAIKRARRELELVDRQGVVKDRGV